MAANFAVVCTPSRLTSDPRRLMRSSGRNDRNEFTVFRHHANPARGAAVPISIKWLDSLRQ